MVSKKVKLFLNHPVAWPIDNFYETYYKCLHVLFAFYIKLVQFMCCVENANT